MTRVTPTRPDGRRGQTLNDYLVGVILLVVTLAGTFAMVPGLFQPFDEPVGPEETSIAERVGDRLIESLSTGDGTNTLDYGAFDATLQSNFDGLLRQSGVPNDRRLVNVTLLDANAGQSGSAVHLSGGSSFFENTSVAATSVRFVRFRGVASSAPDCDPACRLVVRVWQ